MMSGEDSSLVMEDRGSNDEPKTPDFPKKTKTSYDVIIIGAGPAGYTAGIYCSRARHDTLIISGLLPGGQLMNTTDVENYPGFDEGIMGPDLMLTMRKQAERMNTTIIDDVVVNVDFRAKPFKVLTGSEEYEAKAVIVCTGATPRKIGIEGEQTFSGNVFHIVQHVMEHFSEIKTLQLLEEEIHVWKKQHFLQNLHQRFTSFTDEIHSEQVKSCRIVH